VPFKDCYKCLGVVLHATKLMFVAADALAAPGNRAMHAILGRCRQQCITQFNLNAGFLMFRLNPSCRMAARCMWGPEAFVSQVASNKSYTAWSKAEKVHISYLRTMAGVGECCIVVLMRDFHRRLVMHHWVLLAARWFMTLKCMSDDRLSHFVHGWLILTWCWLDLVVAGLISCCTQCLCLESSAGLHGTIGQTPLLIGVESCSHSLCLRASKLH
jgi:hypothetical protein